MGMNLIESGCMPVEVVGSMAQMFEVGKVYEVVVDDRMNPRSNRFAFGLNGKLGEYPTNTKIRLRGEEIQHLYNCTYDEPVTEESGDGFRRVVGTRQVCRFSISPTSWGALPERAMLLQPPGVKQMRLDAAAAPLAEENPHLEGGSEQKPSYDMTVDDMMAARQKELEYLSKEKLMELAAERGTKQSGHKADILDALLKHEEALLRGDD